MFESLPSARHRLPWWRADTSLTVSYTVCLRPTRLTQRTAALPGGKETLPLLGVESGFPAITEPPLDREPLNRAARSGENLIEENHTSEVVTKAASTHANWWGYYRQKD
jgi:hypothetical protein